MMLKRSHLNLGVKSAWRKYHTGLFDGAKMKYTEKEIVGFIKESNAIENVWDSRSLHESIRAWNYLSNNISMLTLMDVLIAHKYILKRLEPKYAGKLRGETKTNVSIGGHIAPEYWSVGSKICDWVNHVNTTITPITESLECAIKRFHVSFEDIHPFGDGNGRIGRLLYCWMREKAGLPIHIIYEKEKYDYYEWFRR